MYGWLGIPNQFSVCPVSYLHGCSLTLSLKDRLASGKFVVSLYVSFWQRCFLGLFGFF